MDALKIIWQVFAAFASMVVLDFIWARYTVACTDQRAFLAGVHAALILALGAVVVLTYVDNHWMLIPACAGGFVGTFLAVRMGNQ